MTMDIADFSKENITEMHNTLLSFILILLEKQEDNKIVLGFTSKELESVAKKVLDKEYTLNTLFEPILNEEKETIGIELILERLNKSDLLLKGLFGKDSEIVM